MIEAGRQQKCFETLKTFNSAIVTIRLYPANAPQITTSVERGYQAMKQHLRHYGKFTFGLRGAEAVLCGEALPDEVLQSISNLIVYRQLTLLQLDRFALAPGIDRGAFKKILGLFSAKVEQVKQEGGGRPFAKRLGLDGFFPEEEEPEPSPPPGLEPGREADERSVSREYIDVLHGREKRAELIDEVRGRLASPEQGGAIIAAAVSGVLGDMEQKQLFAASQLLNKILENCDELLPEEGKDACVRQTASVLLDQLDVPRAVLLFSQDLCGGVGEMLGNALLQQVSLDAFGDIVQELRRYLEQFRRTQSADSPQLQFSTGALDRLLATAKGKQFQGQEKAKSIIEAGEKVRRGKRLQAGIQSLLHGNYDVLQSDEFAVHFPLVIRKLGAEGKEREVSALLKALTMHLEDSDPEIHRRIITSMAQIGEDLVTGEKWDRLRLIAEPLISWVRKSDQADDAYEKTCAVLQTLMVHCLRSKEFELGDNILSVFYQIRSGALKKSEKVRAMVSRAQEQGADRGLLAQLYEECLASPTEEAKSRRLILQGPVVTRFLLDTLIGAERSQDRYKILDLLTYGEPFLPTILTEKLAEPMPWYGRRNLLKLLADCGSEKHLETVYPYLCHEDLRVQREAFACLYKISGKRRKQALLRALAEAGETTKLEVVRALTPFADNLVAKALEQILKEHAYYSPEVQDALLINTCLLLGRCPYQLAEKILRKFLELRGQRAGRKIDATVWQAAEKAMRQLAESQQGERQRQVKASQLRKQALGQTSLAAKKTEQDRKSLTGTHEEVRIRQMLAQGMKDQAKPLLLELITKVAQVQRFTQAEQLRQWLIEIDPMALTEIIRAAEIIEQEKSATVDRQYMEIWADLFDVLTTEEFSTLYHGLEHRTYAGEDLLVKKGDSQASLYFINSGKVKLYYQEKRGEVLVKVLQSGEVLGAGTFFSPSVWTLSAATLGAADIAVLSLEQMQRWRDDYPALESKLNDFCSKFEKVDDFFRNSGKDRRHSQRFKISSRVTAALLNNKGQSTGVNAKGDMVDISCGGTSFFMRISKKENVRLLLGRRMRITMPLDETMGRPVFFDGVVMAVRAHHAMEFEYSVHIEFDELLDKGELQQLL